MGDSPIFELISALLGQECGLSASRSRRLLRIALRDAGLDPLTVTSKQMRIVCQKVLGYHLSRQNVDLQTAVSVCNDLADLMSSSDLPVPFQQSPESIFHRLDSDSFRKKQS